MTQKAPRTGKEFVELANKSDKVSRVRKGKGSHVVVEFKDGNSITIPVHGNRQLGKGILHKIIKVFKAAGILSLILFLVWIGARLFGYV